jgi:hypothetical protein
MICEESIIQKEKVKNMQPTAFAITKKKSTQINSIEGPHSPHLGITLEQTVKV